MGIYDDTEDLGAEDLRWHWRLGQGEMETVVET